MILRTLLLVFILASCGKSNSQESNNTTSETEYKRVELDEFKEIIKDPEVQLVDVRTPGEYSGGYIDDAVNIDYTANDFMSNVEAKLDKEKPVAVYCAAGGRSAKAMEKLRAAGFKKVYELGVGYNGYE